MQHQLSQSRSRLASLSSRSAFAGDAALGVSIVISLNTSACGFSSAIAFAIECLKQQWNGWSTHLGSSLRLIFHTPYEATAPVVDRYIKQYGTTSSGSEPMAPNASTATSRGSRRSLRNRLQNGGKCRCRSSPHRNERPSSKIGGMTGRRILIVQQNLSQERYCRGRFGSELLQIEGLLRFPRSRFHCDCARRFPRCV